MHTPFLSNRLGRWLAVTLLALMSATTARAQLTGTKAIPGDYATVAAAITALNAGGVGAGGVTFNVAAGYTETFAAPTAGAITATGTSANPIVFQKAGTGANPVLTAGATGTGTQDAIISLVGSDYVTFANIDVAENSANTTTATQMEFGYALFRASATDGCQNVNISGATITLNKTNTSTIGIWGANSLATATTAVTATSAAGANSSIKLNGNTVANAFLGIYLAGNTSTAANADTGNEIGTTAGNTLTGLGGSNTSVYGVRAEFQQNLKVENNTIAIPAGNTSTTVYGIGLGTSTATGITGTVLLNNNTISITTATTSTVTGILQGGSSGITTSTITNNKVQNSTMTGATGSVFYIQDASTSAATSVTMTGNQVTGNSATTTGTVYCLYKTASGTALTVTGNTVSNNTKSGAGALAGVFANIAITTLTVSNNTISGNQITAASGSLFGVNLGSSASNSVLTMNGNTITNNTIPNTSGSTASVNYGIYSFGAVSTSETEIGNTITGLSISGAGTASATLRGLYFFNSATPKTISQNNIGNLTLGATGTALTGAVAGIFLDSSTGSTVALSQNKLYGFSAYGTAGVVYGVYLTSTTTPTLSNNLIGSLTAPASTTAQAVSGLYIAGGTTVNIYYNTIYLAGTSTGTGFGSSGIYASTSPTLTLINNIVANNSVATGTGVVAAYRRNGTTLTTYAAASNNNLFYGGTPGTTQAIFTDGTNTYATLAAYKAAMATRDQASATELPTFASLNGPDATFLHFAPGASTQAESGGTPVSGITTDYDGDTRNATTPDIGADEGSFSPAVPIVVTSTAYTQNNTPAGAGQTDQQVTGVVITAAGQINPPALNSVTFNLSGTSLSNISNAKLYSSGSSTFSLASATLLPTTGAVASPSFTLTLTTPVALAAGSNYFFLTYDIPLTATPGTTVASTVTALNVGGTTYTPTLSGAAGTRTIIGPLSGTYYITATVGSSPDPAKEFASLTAAFAAYNSRSLSGPVAFVLRDASYSTAETFPLVLNANSSASATNTLTIRPGAGVSPVISGSVATGAVLKINGADYVTVDGSNAGTTSRDLTITNTSATGSGNAVLWLAAASTTDGATNNVVKNTVITGNSGTGFPQFTVFLGGGGVGVTAPTTSTPAANSNNTLLNNLISKGYYGVFIYGVSATALDQSNTVQGNLIGQSGTGNGFGVEGLRAVFQQGLTVRANEIQNVVNAAAVSHFGLNLGTLRSAVIDRNAIHDVQSNSTTSGNVGYGISLANATNTTAASPSANTVSNNVIYNISAPLASTSSNPNVLGIANGGGYGDRLLFNTILLNVAQTAGTGYSAAISNGDAQFSTASAALDVRNNIIAITANVTTAAKYFGFYTSAANVTGSTLNYNDYYLAGTGSATFAVGNLNGTSLSSSATLAAWQTATGQEANSVSVDPLFAQTATVPFNLTPSNPALDNLGTPISGITNDYAGTTRSTTTPDIGAYEFTPVTIDVAPVALVAPAATSTCYGTAEAVIVSIRNAGAATLNFASNPITVTVVVTLPGGATQTLTATVNNGTLASGATQTVTLPTTLNLSTAGTYSFAISATAQGDQNTGNDVLTTAPTRTVVAPVAGTLSPATSTICVSGTAALTLTGAANGTIQYQSSPDNVTFTDIAGANSATFTTPVLTSTTYFRAQVRCNSGTATSNVSTITVNNPQVASTNTPVSICAGNTATLTAAGSTGASVRFFSAATGGTALATSTPGSYTTPALTASTTYYAEAYTGGASVAGLTDNSASNGTFSQATATDYPLGFAVTQAGTLTSVDVYPTAAGALTIRLYSVTGTQPGGAVTAVAGSDVTITVTAAQVGTRITVPLNYALTAGDYKLSNFAGGLGRYGTYSGTYPLTSADGVLSVKGSYTFNYSTTYSNTTYNSFFNLQFSNECVGGSARTAIQVNVTQPATASFATNTGATCGTSPFALTGTVGGGATAGTYTTSGTGTFSPNATTLNATYTPSTADVAAGSVTITLTATAAPCSPATTTLALSISPAPVATFSYPAATTYCAGSTSTVSPTLGTGATAGTFSSTTGLSINATTGAITLATSTAGTYTVTNTIAASGACAAVSATTTVTIAPATSAAFAYSGGTFCATGTNPTPTVTGTAGGTFSSTTGLSLNASTGAINLSASTPGTYTVTYTVAGACGSGSTQSVTITTAPLATFSYGTTPSYCVSGTTNPAPSFGAGASGGAFSSTTGLTINASTGVITLSSSTPGTYTVTNTITASGGCAAATATATVTITAAPLASFSYGSTTSYCVSGTTAPAVVLGTGATAGTFTSTTGLSINASTGALTLSSSTPGTYTVTNTVAAANGCAATTATTQVTITAAPVATFSYPAATTYCAGSTSTVSPTLGTGATAGTFSSTTGLSINATTGAITLATSTAGTYTVTNTIAAANGCATATATATVTIAPATSATFAYSGTTFCATGTNPTPNVTGTAGGTFSSTTGLSINATTGAITLSSSTPGTYTVTYTVAGACGSSATATVTITSGLVATFSYGTGTPTFCVSGTTNPTATLGTGATAGTFTSTTGLTINATTGAITLSSSIPGTYTVTNTVAASGGCAATTATASVTITAAPIATFSYGTSSTFCVSGTTAPAVVLGTGATAGTFSSTTGLTINATTGAITLASSTPGTYTVTNTIAANGGCAAATATATVTITAAPLASFSYGSTTSYCVSGTTAPAVVLGTGATAGTFSSTTGLSINATTGAINLSASTPGTYTVTNTVAAANGCAAATATTSVTITAAPLATFSYATSAGCVGSTAAVSPTLGTGATAGTFSSTTGLTINATTGAITLSSSTAGTYTVTNTVAAAGGCAAATATTTFTVNPRPATPTLTATYNGTTTTLTSSATTGNQFYLGGSLVTGATGQTLVLTGLPAQLGSYTVTTTNANGCVSLPSNALVVTSARNGIAGASLKLYPNPTPNGQVTTLELTGYRLATQLTVLDALGRVVATELLPANVGTATHALDLMGVATGVYLLRLSNADGVETRRLVRE